MPRLTVDPQVKSNQHLPYAVASWAVLHWWVMKTHLVFSSEPLIFGHPFLRSKTWLTNLAHGLLCSACSSTVGSRQSPHHNSLVSKPP